jgi:hypothetical protein
MMHDMRRFAACVSCDLELFDSKTRQKEPHPFAGEISIRGKALSSAWRITWVLMNGDLNRQLICADCLADEKLLSNFPRIWKRCINRQLLSLEPDARKAMNYPPLNSEQLKIQQESTLELMHNRPLGIIDAQRWLEIVT